MPASSTRLAWNEQSALYSILKLKLFVPVDAGNPGGLLTSPISPGASVGAGGATSTIAMLACCAHHVTDVLPILGLTAAATFLAQYRLAFMVVGLGTTLLGIGFMLLILIRERRRIIRIATSPSLLQETL